MGWSYQSWGRYPRVRQCVKVIEWMSDPVLPKSLEESPNGLFLPYGVGRSYGDSCLNEGGLLLSTERLKHFMSFDPKNGLLCAEAGVTLSEVLEFAVPRGFFLPVTPGTRFVTLGGAVANDIHGKNHHRAGTFGRHVTRIMLMRSDGTRSILGPQSNPQLFKATIGGLGLTGLMLAVELKLRPIESPFIKMESIKFNSLDEFFEISGSSDEHFEHTVAWLDCVAGGNSFGRGIFMRGNHAALAELPVNLTDKGKWRKYQTPRSILSVPFDFPPMALNNFTVKLFNTLYYNKQTRRSVISFVPYLPFFYPLDAIGDWNRIYGKRGLFQFQCVVPAVDRDPIKRLLKVVVESGRASFLAVLKEFGTVGSPGLLSFPRRGVTLCMDLPNQGEASLALLARLEAMVRDFGGAMYPAKDACMSGQSFRAFYPGLSEFAKQIDAKSSSSFWRRVMG
jgi:FAD/FMN-containing dehydrogenase